MEKELSFECIISALAQTTRLGFISGKGVVPAEKLPRSRVKPSWRPSMRPLIIRHLPDKILLLSPSVQEQEGKNAAWLGCILRLFELSTGILLMTGMVGKVYGWV